MLTKNLGGADRIIRLVVGIALGGAAYAGAVEGPAKYIVAAAGAVAFLTGLIGWCGLYYLLGRNTCKIDKP